MLSVASWRVFECNSIELRGGRQVLKGVHACDRTHAKSHAHQQPQLNSTVLQTEAGLTAGSV